MCLWHVHLHQFLVKKKLHMCLAYAIYQRVILKNKSDTDISISVATIISAYSQYNKYYMKQCSCCGGNFYSRCKWFVRLGYPLLLFSLKFILIFFKMSFYFKKLAQTFELKFGSGYGYPQVRLFIAPSFYPKDKPYGHFLHIIFHVANSGRDVSPSNFPSVRLV